MYNLHQLAKGGKLDQVPKRLLTMETMLVKNNYGETPLHLAAAGGHLYQVPKELLTQETMVIKDNAGGTLLHYAFFYGHQNQVPKELLTLETMLVRNESACSPLDIAVEVGCLDQLLGIDFGESLEVKGIVGEEWWGKNLEVLRQSQALIATDEKISEIELF